MNSAILWEQKHLQFQLSSVVSFFTGHKPDSNCLRGEVADTDKPLFISSPHTGHLIQAKMKRNARIQCLSMGTCKRESWRHGSKGRGRVETYYFGFQLKGSSHFFPGECAVVTTQRPGELRCSVLKSLIFS